MLHSVHDQLKNEYNLDVIIEQPDWILCRYNEEIVTLAILHISFTEQLLFVGRKFESNRLIQSGFLTNITQFILSGSVETWQEGDISNTKLYKQGDSINVDKMNKWTQSPSFNFLNTQKLMIHYESNTWTLEYVRSYLPIWYLSSFINNLFYFEFTSLFKLSTILIDYIVKSGSKQMSLFIEKTHECCRGGIV
jgi:hypothetical protein